MRCESSRSFDRAAMLELCFSVADQGKWLWKRSVVDVDDDVLWRSGTE
jgi:hypothetical protein